MLYLSILDLKMVEKGSKNVVLALWYTRVLFFGSSKWSLILLVTDPIHINNFAK